jgi:hypothetical protein
MVAHDSEMDVDSPPVKDDDAAGSPPLKGADAAGSPPLKGDDVVDSPPLKGEITLDPPPLKDAKSDLSSKASRTPLKTKDTNSEIRYVLLLCGKVSTVLTFL